MAGTLDGHPEEAMSPSSRSRPRLAIPVLLLLFACQAPGVPIPEMADGYVASDPDMVGWTSDGLPAITNELVIVAEEGAPVDAIVEQVAATGGQVVGGYVSMDRYQARFPDAETTEAAIPTLEQAAGIAAAVHNYLLFPESAPPYRHDEDDYPSPGSWWLDQSRVPPAWLVADGFDGAGEIAGAIALLLSADPSLQASEAVESLVATADPIQPDLPIGSGRLNVWKAMLMVVNREVDEHDDTWFGLEIVVDPALASVRVNGTDVGEWHLHTIEDVNEVHVARLNVQGSVLGTGDLSILGYDDSGQVVLRREGIDLDWPNWDDYVYRVPPEATIYRHIEAIGMAGCYSYPPYICDCWPCTSWFARYGIFPAPDDPDDDFIPFEELTHGQALTVTWSASRGVFVPFADGEDDWVNPLVLAVEGDSSSPEQMPQDGTVSLEYDFVDGMPWCGDQWIYEDYTVQLEVCTEYLACSTTELVDVAGCRVD